MKRTLIALTGILLCLLVKGQVKKPLRTGDKMPDVTIHLLTDKGVEVVSLSKLYQQHALILDFWATWCGACIRAIKQGDSVVQPFAGKVLLLPISYESRETVQSFIQKNKVLRQLKTFYGVEDTLLMGQLISFKILPHEVWVGKDGIIKAITYAEDVTTENVSLLSRDELTGLPLKRDDMTFDPFKPLEAEPAEILARSLLTRHKEGVSSMTGTLAPALRRDVMLDRYFAINTSLLGLYYSVYSKNSGMLQRDRVAIFVKDSGAIEPTLKYPKNAAGSRALWKYSYCYELITPTKMTKPDFFDLLLSELNRMLPYTVRIEKKKMTCYVITNPEPAKNQGSQFLKDSIYWEGGIAKGFYHQSMETVRDYLNWNMAWPVIDESNYGGCLDMVLNLVPVRLPDKNVFDPVLVRESLKQYGFELTAAERMTDILVIRDK